MQGCEQFYVRFILVDGLFEFSSASAASDEPREEGLLKYFNVSKT